MGKEDTPNSTHSKSLVIVVFFIIVILVLLFFLLPFGQEKVLLDKTTPTGSVEVIKKGNTIEVEADSNKELKQQ